MTRSRRSLYQRSTRAMLRAAVNLTPPNLPAWPDPVEPLESWRDWLSAVWLDEVFRTTLSAATPDLGLRVDAFLAGELVSLRRARRMALSVASYALRYTQRSTPFGLFAGVALCDVQQDAEIQRFADLHHAVGRPHPLHLDALISAVEADPERMAAMEVCVNSLAIVREGRVFIPSEGDAEFSLALNHAVQLVLDTARAPIHYADLGAKLEADFPTTTAVQRDELLTELLRVRLLRSAMRAPATTVFPPSAIPRSVPVSPDMPSATDVRLDGTVVLSAAVATEAATAATVLTRLVAHPTGIEPWRRYAERFAARYGDGVLVALELLTDQAQGLGFPDGFGKSGEAPRPMTRRDRLLLGLAGTAALEGTHAVTLTEAMIEELEAAAGRRELTPPHLELCAQVQAASVLAMNRGEFRLRVATVSRSAGSMTGRFWDMFPDFAAEHAELPTLAPDAELVQLSFHPSRVHADLLTRVPQVLPRVVSIGEFRHPGPGVLLPADLAVGIDKDQLFLAEAATGRRLEVLAPTALNFLWNNYTHPLTRFIAEISRAATPQVNGFDWGAAWTLPFTPALRHRRTVLIPARWQLKSTTLPGRHASLNEWTTQLYAWRSRVRLPDRVLVAEDDQQLPLDLNQPMHLDLLRRRLSVSRTGAVTLYDAPPPDANGWLGGRAHSIVFPLVAS
ncbi:lantibiotic dehydratase family protein [Streptacidiphilus jiangxiensis]|uniref:Lantibiotic dehydratase, C terminus n=2 Tax=Streptacidiphilus jiangxiensis TaxID=235985 RepID=A0A1H7H2I3_STRJI|nr:lantibiotic dehydratase family protein [Streptacidiphilus jiangxiensis]SEK44448.1 Lantibiotic dehydratase, C terminus [Streptacidiphilus jiangxiensis]